MGHAEKHILTVHDLPNLPKLFLRAEQHRDAGQLMDAGALGTKVLTTLFYEPSTRTRISFEAAMHGLGGRVISTENAGEFSSAIKGETLEDTIRIVSANCHAIALRHPDVGAAVRAASVATVPIINAGDGDNEHPTQTALDLFTIWDAIKKKRLPERPLKIAFLGDNERSRTVRSLARKLARSEEETGVPVREITFVEYGKSGSPGPELKKELGNLCSIVPYASHWKADTDVLYITRLQKERYPEGHPALSVPLLPGFSRADAEELPEHAIIMHPLPRVDELLANVDDDPRAWYFKQAANGKPVRMALLEHVLGERVSMRY